METELMIKGTIKREGWGYKIYISAFEIEKRGFQKGDNVLINIIKKEEEETDEELKC